VLGWFRSLRLRSRADHELDEEMQSHVARYVEDLVANGTERCEADRRARAEFGGLESFKEQCRDAAGLRWLTGLRRDFRYALRLLRKTPGVSTTAILTLALCIGANTAIFSVVDAVLLRPLPYDEPDRLANVITSIKGQQSDMVAVSGHVWEVLRDRASGFEVAALAGSRGVNLFANGVAEHVQQQRVSADFFRVLGVRLLAGRGFESSEDRSGGPAVAIISHSLWRSAFGGDRSTIGGYIALKGEPHLVVGIMPEGFQTISRADVWTPLRASTDGEGSGSNYMVVARLKPGVSWSQANSEAQSLGAAAPEALKKSTGRDAELKLISLQDGITQLVRAPLLVLWGAVGLVLLIGCVNIAGLLLARSTERRRELATRMALGGGSGVLVRQLLAESLLLALTGGVIGAALGYAGVRALRVTLASSLGLWQTITVDERVLSATFALSLITSVLFGILPAWEATRVDIRAALLESDTRTVAGHKGHWPRRLLVVGEVALGMLLLVGAALLLRTFTHLMGLNPGFDSTNVVTAKISLEDARYREAPTVVRLYDESLARIRAIPGVESAAVSLTLPYERALNTAFVRKDGPEAGPPWQIMNACYVAGEYFQALRVPLLRGRLLDGRDHSGSAPVAVVNEAFVRRYLSRQEPVGSHIQDGRANREIVGVVGDVQQKAGWGNFGPLAAIPQMYYPAAQTPSAAFRLVHTWFAPTWIVRTKGPQAGLTATIQQAVQSIDPQLPFAGFQTLDGVRSGALAAQRFQATIVGIMAALALVLSALGIYGLVAHTVNEKTREFGIRMALGATAAQGMRAVALPAALLAGAGVVTGMALSRGAATVLQKVVWGVSATDPLTIAAAGIILLVIAAIAGWIPAVRLTRLNPAETLRHE
jgi:predicted permease